MSNDSASSLQAGIEVVPTEPRASGISTEETTTSAESRRLWIVVTMVLAFLVTLHFSPLKSWLEDVRSLKQAIAGYGLAAYGAFAMGSIAAIAVGVPRLPLCGLAGLLFGFVGGALVSLVSSMAGSYGAFLIARWSGRAWAERKLSGASHRIRTLLANPSIGAIFVARQLPVPGIVPNVLLGVLPTTHRTFLIGTLVGYLPSTAIVALAGSSLGKDTLETAIAQVTLSMTGLAVLSVLLLWLQKRLRERE